MKKFLIAAFLVINVFTAKSQSIPKWKITDVEQYIADGKGAVLVINFWATFCKPCVAEIPGFIRIVEKYKANDVKLMLVSLDLPSFYPSKIASFSKKHAFKTNMVWLDETNADYFCPKIDPSWSGSIPATLIVNTKTGYRKFFEEEVSATTFEAALKLALQPAAAGASPMDHSFDLVGEPE